MPPIVINSMNYADYSYLIPYIRYCAEDKYSAQWLLKNRSISDYEFVFITSGEGNFQIENRVYKVKPNDLILFKPGVSHYGSSLTCPFNFLCIHFDLFTTRILKHVECESNFVQIESIPSKPVKYCKAILEFSEYISTADPAFIHQLMLRIIHENARKQPGYNLIIKSVFTEMLFSLFRQKHQISQQSIETPEIQAINKYIQANYMRKISLADIARNIYLQPSYISALFKKQTGRTITEFIKMHRIAAAKCMLLETTKKIEDIAESIGFYDIHHFSKVFKEHEGLTPSQYRSIKDYK